MFILYTWYDVILLSKFYILYSICHYVDVREQISEKADSRILRVFSFLAYVAFLVTFIWLIITESERFILETEIKTYDATGTDGWECITISKANQAYTIDDTSEPAQHFYLVNVMQTPSALLDALTTTEPCNYQEYVSGTVEPFDFGGNGAKFLAFSPNGTFVSVFAMGSQYFIFLYDEDGTNNARLVNSGTSSEFYGLAIDNEENVWMIKKSFGAYFIAVEMSLYDLNQEDDDGGGDDGGGDDYSDDYYGDDDFGGGFGYIVEISRPYLFVDNLNNLYYLTTSGGSCDVYRMVMGAGGVEETLVWSYACQEGKGDQMYSAVYNYGNGPDSIVYYGVATNSSDLKAYFMSYEAGVETVIFSTYDLEETTNYENYPMLAVDADRSIYYGWGDVVERYVSAVSDFDTMPSQSSPVLNLVFNPTHSMLAIGVDLPNVKLYNMTSDLSQYINKMTEFGMAWFQCGADIVSPVPSEASSFALGCKDNGVVGATLLEETYYLTVSSAMNYATQVSEPICSAYIPAVVETTKDLPPYSCDRKVYPGFF